MKTILIGNGINIQFGGVAYTNANIIKRALANLQSGNFPDQIYPADVGVWLSNLHGECQNILSGGYDSEALFPDEANSLSEFKSKYGQSERPLEVHDIGFEDYFFIHVLFCRSRRIENPEKYYAKEGLRYLFLDSIYNSGAVLRISANFPQGLKPFLGDFDKMFTTNYDSNVATFTGKPVHYLHGAFHILDDSYNPTSLRNKMADAPAKAVCIPRGYEYLYSNALTSYSGNGKELVLNIHRNANEGLRKVLTAIDQNPKLPREIEALASDKNPVVIAFYQSIKAKRENPNDSFSESYPMPEFLKIEGELHIVGLSPQNDSHILNAIVNNSKLERVRYYYFERGEGENVVVILRGKQTELCCVKQLWNSLDRG